MMEDHNRQSMISLTCTDEQGRLTLSLPRLADVFRRAGGGVFAEPELAHIFNVSALRLAEALAELEKSGRIDHDITRALTKIALLAADNEIERIILPVSEGGKAGEHLNKNIMYGEKFSRHYNVSVSFQNEPYVCPPEVESLGEPKEKTATTIFDFGLFPVR